MMKWKVCGMRDLNNIEAVAACEPDFMGFIWVEKSPRYVGEDFVIPNLPAKTKAVGVFVNGTTENIILLSKILFISSVSFSKLQLSKNFGPSIMLKLQAVDRRMVKLSLVKFSTILEISILGVLGKE